MKKGYVYLKKLRRLSNRLRPQNSYSLQQQNRGDAQQKMKPDNTAPTWSAERVKAEAEKYYNEFVEEFQGEDPATITSALIKENAILKACYFQLVEWLTTNRDLSKGAFENAHLAMQKYEELDETSKSQGRHFSERIERLERKLG